MITQTRLTVVMIIIFAAVIAACRTAPPPSPPVRHDILTPEAAIAAANRAARVFRVPAGTRSAARAFPWAAKLRATDIKEFGEMLGGWIPIDIMKMIFGPGKVWRIDLTQFSRGGAPDTLSHGCSVWLMSTHDIRAPEDMLRCLQGRGPRAARLIEVAICRPDVKTDRFFGSGRYERITTGSPLTTSANPNPARLRRLSARPGPLRSAFR